MVSQDLGVPQQIRTEVQDAIARYCGAPELVGPLTKVLSRPGFALHPDSSCQPGVFALTVFRSVRRDAPDTEFLVAAAAELYVEAGFLFDHVADDELDPNSGNTPAEEIALAIAVMNVGAATVSAAARQSPLKADLYTRLERFFADMVIACTGQYLDAYLELRDGVSTEDAHRMTALKGGGYGRQIASLAASLATDDTETIELFGQLGFELLSQMQIIDDLRDALPSESQSGDFSQYKKTVPLTFFYPSLEDDQLPRRDGILGNQVEWSDDSIRSLYEVSGANEFASIVAETHLNRARELVVRLADRLGPVEDLERHVEALESNPQEIVSAT